MNASLSAIQAQANEYATLADNIMSVVEALRDLASATISATSSDNASVGDYSLAMTELVLSYLG
jgi:hypothetical protein